MEHSFVADGEVHDAMATGHRPWFGTKRPLPENTTDRATAPQGGIIASASDLARYLQMMMNGQDDVLSAEGKALMMRPASAASPSYGLGWFIDSGQRTVWHPDPLPVSRRSRPWLPPRRARLWSWSTAAVGWASGKPPNCSTASPPGAFGLDYDGEGPRIWQKILSIGLVALPIIYLLAVVRRRLLTGHERLSDRSFARMWNQLIDTGDPGLEVLVAYTVKENLRQLLALAGTHPDREVISHRLWRFYDQAAESRSPEVHRLAATVEAWWSAIEAAITTGYSNARSEGYNRLAKHQGRNAFGFRNTDNQRRRIRWACTRQHRRATATITEMPG